MAVRCIRTWPDPVLSTPTAKVAAAGPKLRTLVADLFDTMYASDGIGLAANQVGVDAQVVVIDLDPQGLRFRDAAWAKELARWGYDKPLALVNPEIVSGSGRILWEEGCLSVPEFNAEVERQAEVTLRALDAEGKPFTVTARGLFAVCLQHELDHLAGVVFVDRLAPKLQRRAVALLEERLVRPAKKRQKSR